MPESVVFVVFFKIIFSWRSGQELRLGLKSEILLTKCSISKCYIKRPRDNKFVWNYAATIIQIKINLFQQNTLDAPWMLLKL
jgi:hypothetical protein